MRDNAERGLWSVRRFRLQPVVFTTFAMLALSGTYLVTLLPPRAQAKAFPHRPDQLQNLQSAAPDDAAPSILPSCVSAGCRRSIPDYLKLRSSRFKLLYGTRSPICATIQTAMNARLDFRRPSIPSEQTAPRRPYHDIDFENIFAAQIFRRWHRVPAFYNDPALYWDDNSSMSSPGVTDAFVVVPFLNDGVPQLVVAWPHGQEYSTFTADADKLFSATADTPLSRGKLFDPAVVTSVLQSALRGLTNQVPVLKTIPMSECLDFGDPLQAPTYVDSSRRKPDGVHCSTGNLDHIHIPSADRNRYPSVAEIGRYGGVLSASATEFAVIDDTVYVLYANTDSDAFSPEDPHHIAHLPSAIVVRVIRFGPTGYTDECLLAATASTAISTENNQGKTR